MRGGGTYALDYPRPLARDMALDDLIARRAHDEGATGFDGREKGIAFLEAGLERLQGLMKLVQEPFELSRLRMRRSQQFPPCQAWNQDPVLFDRPYQHRNHFTDNDYGVVRGAREKPANSPGSGRQLV